MAIVKIGRIQLTEEEANNLYFSGRRYLCAYRRIYQLNWCENYTNADGKCGGVYGTEIYYHEGELPLTKRGRFIAVAAEDVNRMIGYKLLKVE